jgi:hypothetical protein
MSKSRNSLLILCLCVATSTPAAQCESISEGAALLELFTTEGCSSCPPAEAWLNNVDAKANMVPIAFHVDYWAYLGWPDRFALSGNEARHSQRARAAGTGVYTPGIYLNGERSGIGAQYQKRAESQWRLRVSWDEQQRVLSATAFERAADCADASCERALPAFFAITENKLSSHVKAGENRGRQLHHNHVARQIWQGSKSQRLASSIDLRNAQLVAWREHQGKASEALAIRLADCRD